MSLLLEEAYYYTSALAADVSNTLNMLVGTSYMASTGIQVPHTVFMITALTDSLKVLSFVVVQGTVGKFLGFSNKTWEMPITPECRKRRT